MNIALVGSSGYISGFLIQRLLKEEAVGQLLKIDQTDEADAYLDLSAAENFNYELLAEIDFVIFTAAVSGPDKCAAEFHSCWDINVTGTNYFIKEAIAHDCKVLFFSSDAVFGNIPAEIYTEESETLATTPYGRMKKAVEDQFRDNPNFKAIRLSYVVSARDRFVSYCLECIKKNQTADVFHPFYRNCVVVSDVVNVVVWMILHWSEYTPFVLNVAGKELVSRIRIADEINRYLGDKLQYTISQPAASFYQNRPAITQMASLYNSKYHILNDYSFTEKIQKELEEIRNEF